jgi:hypothetical protein
MRYSWPTLVKAAACTVIYPTLPILVLGVARNAPPANGIRDPLVTGLSWILWPVRIVAEGLERLIDDLGPQGLDEPVSMLLPPWAVWTLTIVSVFLPSCLVFAACAFAFGWRDSKGR